MIMTCVLLVAVALFRPISSFDSMVRSFQLDLGAEPRKRWDPERQRLVFEESYDDSALAMRAAVSRELKRSLRQYKEAQTTAEALELLRVQLERVEKSILVVEGRMFLSVRHFHLFKHKKQYHLEFLKSVIERSEGAFPNVAYLFEESAMGVSRASPDDPTMPLVVIAKMRGYAQSGLLLPNPYFEDLGNWEKAQEVVQKDRQKQTSDWAARDKRCLWRGAITTRDFCASDSGNYARFCAVVKAGDHPDILDVKSVGALNPRDPGEDPNDDLDCSEMPYDAAMREVFAKNERNDTAAYQAPFMEPRQFTRYRFLLNLPGVMSGSYSRNLNNLWNTGAVVVLWNAPHVEWYYPALRHGHTHVAVDCGTLVDQLTYYNDPANAAAVDRLRANALKVYDEFLSPHGLARYTIELMTAIRDHHRFADILDDKNTRFAALRDLNCSRFLFVEVLISDNTPIDRSNNATKASFRLKPIAPDDPVLGPCAQLDALATPSYTPNFISMSIPRTCLHEPGASWRRKKNKLHRHHVNVSSILCVF